jgi:signal transduction histidine kinase
MFEKEFHIVPSFGRDSMKERVMAALGRVVLESEEEKGGHSPSLDG